jgi:hypothetical protein
MRFAVILPTVRQRSGEVIGALLDSRTMPLDLFVPADVMGEGEGHAQAVNAALGWLDPARHDVVVKMDDDLRLYAGWQDTIAQAMVDLPDAGVIGLDLAHHDAGFTYMVGGMPDGVMIEQQAVGQTRYREVTVGNVGGVFMASPTRLVLDVGKIPDGGVGYQFYADAWVNEQARKRGYRTVYAEARPAPVLITYDDPAGYVKQKSRDADTMHREWRRYL